MDFRSFRTAMLLGLAGTAPSACDRATLPGSQGSQPKDRSNEFPVKRTLRDDGGRTIDVDIVGRRQSRVTIVRRRSGRVFTFPISRLSGRDEQFVRDLPIDRSSRSATSSDPSADNQRIVSRQREIERIEVRIAEKEEEKRDFEPGTPKARSIDREIEELRVERRGMKKQISEIRSR